MKKWWQWFLLTLVWLATALLNLRAHRSTAVIGYNLGIAGFFAVLAVVQYVCDRHGEKGKRIFNRIAFLSTLLLVLAAVLIICLN